MRLFPAILVAATILGAGPPLGAAEIAPAKRPSCDLVLSGEIEDGDVSRLEAANSAHKPRQEGYPRLCLNSPGGSYDEALRLIGWLMDTTNVYTVVDKGDECYSACSLVFMFGNHNEGDAMISPRRGLHVGAKLGFHTPHITPAVDTSRAEVSAKAYRAGIKAIARLLEIDWDNWFPKSLLIEALKREPEEFLFVDTVAKAASWGIPLVGFQPPKVVTEAMLEAACLNEARRESNRWMRRWWGAGDSPTGQREAITAPAKPVQFKRRHHRAVFKGFGSEDSYACVVDIYDGGERGYRLDINFGDTANDPKIPKPQIGEAVASSVWNGAPGWYLFRGDTVLRKLQAP